MPKQSKMDQFGGKEAYITHLEQSCPLRKPCDQCHKEYGRRVRITMDGYPYLEPMGQWKNSRFCSVSCQNAHARVAGSERAKRAFEAAQEAKRLHSLAYARFCFIGRLHEIEGQYVTITQL